MLSLIRYPLVNTHHKTSSGGLAPNFHPQVLDLCIAGFQWQLFFYIEGTQALFLYRGQPPHLSFLVPPEHIEEYPHLSLLIAIGSSVPVIWFIPPSFSDGHQIIAFHLQQWFPALPVCCLCCMRWRRNTSVRMSTVPPFSQNLFGGLGGIPHYSSRCLYPPFCLWVHNCHHFGPQSRNSLKCDSVNQPICNNKWIMFI